MRKINYTLLLLFISSILYSQDLFKISGSIFDENNKPLANVNVFTQQSKKGTVSNKEGTFSLNFSVKDDLIIFSYMGYENYSVKAFSTSQPLQIRMKPSSIQINEVTVTNLTAKELLDKAISKIPENYPQDEFLAKMYYRAKINVSDDSLLYVEETSFEQVKSYKSSFEDKVFLVKNRNFNFKNGSQIAIRGIGNFDNVKTLIQKERSRNKNIYSYGTFTNYDGHRLYTIEINKNIEKDNLTKGKIYIDTDDLAFIRFELAKDDDNSVTQYKKIDGKYYLIASNSSSKNRKQNGNYQEVSSQMSMTELVQSFKKEDIQGVLIENDEALQAYTDQNTDPLFWKIHNEILPDTSTQKKIKKYLLEQNLESQKGPEKDFVSYEKLYRPHLTLRFSNTTPNDIYSFAQSTVSINQLSYYFTQKWLKNIYLGVLLPSLANVYLISPLEEIEVERKLLSLNSLHSRMNPLSFNSLNKSYHYGLSQTQLDHFKSVNYTDFMRLHTIRNEYHYIKTKILEEEIAKVDLSNKNNRYDFIKTYIMDLVYNRAYNLFYSPLKDKDLNINDKNKEPIIVDTDKSWVKYLFERDEKFNSHITSNQLTIEEKRFLKRSTYLSWMNLISPQMLGIRKFGINENLKFTFSLNYLRIPFGEMTEQNLWFSYKKHLNGLFIRQYFNKEKIAYGLGYKMYDVKLNKDLSITSTFDYWLQPEKLQFDDNALKSGFHFGQDLEYKLWRDQYTKLNKLSIYIGYDYKTKGYLPEEIKMTESFLFNFGFKINL